MNSRIVVAVLLIATGLGAVALWLDRDPEAKGGLPLATQAPAADGTAPSPGTKVEAPTPASPTVPGDPGRTQQQPPAPDLSLEPVEAMLELNLIAAGGAVADASAEPSSGSIDELLGGKHYGKTKDQLERSLRSVEAVLAKQHDPGSIPKEQILSAEALSALRIEAAWLKERVY